jgi:hypothetical protein
VVLGGSVDPPPRLLCLWRTGWRTGDVPRRAVAEGSIGDREGRC